MVLPSIMESGMEKIIHAAIIVSDDNIIINQIRKIVNKYNYSIIVVRSVLESISIALEQETDLFIVDLNFSQNTAMKLIKIIKKMRPRLPIVVLSEDFLPETMRKFFEAQIFYYAFKPIQTEEIEKVLEAAKHFHRKQKNIDHTISKKTSLSFV